MKKIIIALLFLAMNIVAASAQEKNESIDKIRTQSGVDPTRVTSRMSYSFLTYDKANQNVQINNRIVATLGVNRWSLQLKSDIVSVNNTPADGFTTGFGDLKFSILNAFYVKGKSALAASVEFGLPTASSNIAPYAGAGGYFYATPSLTYSYTITPSLMFALQPQYSFNIAKARNYPDMSVLTVRTFMAKFFKSGLFLVLEPRPIYNFTDNKFDLVISPIVGKNLGGGYNLVLLAEIYTNHTSAQTKGNVFQIGFSKAF